MSTLLSRLACRLFGHTWAPTSYGWELCTQRACRHRPDARRRVR